MSIIYSYPEQAPLNLNDMLIGTSSVKVGGKQKNITRNFSLKQIADFIGEGGAVFNPTASDFQIGVFNQGGTKLTGSIMSQDTFPGGTGITVAGNLTTTNNLTALGDVVLGNQQLTNNIKLLSETYLSGQIRDIGGNLGNTDQILISNNIGFVSWTDYKAGLVYQGVWNATTGRTTPDNILLESGIGQNGQFYIVTVAGNYQLDGNPASPESPPYWQIGDWVIFVSKGNTNEWQKIDNTSALTGTGTDNKIAMWTGGATPSVTLTDSLISQDAGATVVTVAGALTSTGNISGVNITGTGNLSGDNLLLTGTVSLNTQLGSSGQVLTSQGTADAIWANPTPVNNITGSGTVNTLSMFTNQYAVGDSIVTQDAGGTIVTTAGNSSITGYIQPATIRDAGASPGTAGQVLSSTGTALDWVNSSVGDTYTLSAGAISGSSVPLNLDAAAGADSVVNLTGGTGITLTQTSATEITIEGSAQGVTGSGTSGKLPKFDTATSLNDSIVTQSGGTTTITPLINNVISFNPQTSSFTMANYATNNTVTGPAPQVGDVLNFVLISDLTWAVGGGVIPAGTYPYTVTFSGSGLSCNFNSYTIPASTSGYGYTNMLGNGSSTGTNTIDVLAIDGELSMVTHQIKNVVNPTDAQDAATKNYVDSIPRGVMTFGTSDSGATITVSGGAPDPRVKANTAAVTSASTSLATGAQIQTAINAAVANVGAFQGAYDAATNTPDLDTAPSAAIQNGWFWAVTVAGTFFSENVQIGDFIFANQDNPGATFANWTVIQSGQDIAGSGTTDGATVKGVAGFNSNDFDVSVNGWVEAKDFSGSTPGYVPDATSAATGTFLKKDGTWAVAGSLTGTGTQYKVPLWSNVAGTALGNSLFTQDSSATKVTLDGLLEVLGDGTLTGTGGQIKLNCSLGTHGITIESAPHSDNATYTLILPATAGVTGQVLTSGGSSAGAQLSWTALPAGYTGWTVQPDIGSNITVSSGLTLPIRGVVTAGAGIETNTNNPFGKVNIDLKNNGGTPSATTFYRGDGQWATPSGASATITTRSTTTIDATTTVFALGATPNGGLTSFVDVFIDGVYQEISTYSVTGTTNITFGAAVPLGVTVETKTTSDYNVGAAVQSVNGMTGTVLLNNPSYVTGNSTASNGGLYIFDSTTQGYTLTLPGSPSLGDSIKISIRGGLATNALNPGSTNKIMGVTGSMTINNTTAAFEIIWAAGSQGWVIIGNV